jgi:TonB family protein
MDAPASMPLALFLAAALAAAVQPPAPTPAAPSVPRSLPGTVITSDDYPEDAIRRRAEGNVRVRLEIAPEGRVTGCAVIASSGDSLLDSTTCSLLLRRARYEAAAAGTARVHERTVAWRLPEPDAWPFELVRFVTTMEAERGAIVRCSTSAAAGAETGTAECKTALPRPMVAWLEAQTGRAAVTLTQIVTPEPGPPPPAQAADAGRLVSLVWMEVKIAPDGRVTECRETMRQMPLPLPMLALPPDACASSLRFTPSSLAAERRARIIMTVHLRRDRPAN